MNIIERKRLEYMNLIRGVGSKMRFLRLDTDESSPEQEAAAQEIFESYSETVLKDGLHFCGLLHEHADRACPTCGGEGAVCVGQKYSPCECAKRNEVARIKEARKQREETAPVIPGKHQGTRSTEIDKRITEVRRLLGDAEARLAEVIDPVLEEIRQVESEVSSYQARRATISDELALGEASVASAEQAVVEARRLLDNAHEALSKAKEAYDEKSLELSAFDSDNAELASRRDALLFKRDHIGQRQRDKVDKYRKTLRRLTYLRGGGGGGSEAEASSEDKEAAS
jgi:hypothetical protein